MMAEEKKTVLERLLNVQHEPKAPKGQRNSFGNYNYRSAEDILEAVKPLLTKYSLLQTITDEVVLIGDRYYIKATVTLYDAKIGVSQNVGTLSNNTVTVSAYAREADQKKGMDEAQVTDPLLPTLANMRLTGYMRLMTRRTLTLTNTRVRNSNKQKESRSLRKRHSRKRARRRKQLRRRLS